MPFLNIYSVELNCWHCNMLIKMERNDLQFNKTILFKLETTHQALNLNMSRKIMAHFEFDGSSNTSQTSRGQSHVASPPQQSVKVWREKSSCWTFGRGMLSHSFFDSSCSTVQGLLCQILMAQMFLSERSGLRQASSAPGLQSRAVVMDVCSIVLLKYVTAFPDVSCPHHRQPHTIRKAHWLKTLY